MIHSGNIFQSCSRRFLLFQERKAAKNAALISMKLKHLGRRLIYLKPVPFFSDIGSEDCFLCTTPSKELKKHLQMQLKKWTLSKKKGKKKIAVNIWSTDSLFLYQVILEATNSTNTGKGRIQDSSENYTATVLLIFFFTCKVSFWMEFITFNKNFSKINLYSLY